MKKKVLAFVAIIAIIVMMIPITGMAAEKTEKDLYDVKQTTNKSTYSANEDITMTLEITNISDFTKDFSDVVITNIAPDGYKVKTGSKAEKEIKSLKTGETASLATTFEKAPSTGDNNTGTIFLFGGMALLALLVIIGIIIGKIKHKNITTIIICILVAGATILAFANPAKAGAKDSQKKVSLTTNVTVDKKELPVKSTVVFDLEDSKAVIGEAEYKADEETKIEIKEGDDVKAKATIPEGAKIPEGTEKIVMVVDNTEKPEAIELEENQDSLNVDISFYSVKEDGSKTPITDFGDGKIVSVDLSTIIPDGYELVKVFNTHNPSKPTEFKKAESSTGLEEGEFYYNLSTKTMYLASSKFSPFTFVIEAQFAGGTGTKDKPYIVKTEEQFLNLDDVLFNAPETTTDIYFKLESDMDMSKPSIQHLKGKTWNRWRWFGLYDDVLNQYNYDTNLTIHIDLGGNKVLYLDCFLFDDVQKLDIKNGTVILSDGENEPGIVYFCEPDETRNLSFANLVLDGNFEANMLHYGPLLAQSYGSAEGTVSCKNITSNLEFTNVAAGAYTGGLLGYSAGAHYIQNCTINGSIQSALIGGFINPMNASTTFKAYDGNKINAKLLGTNTVQKFGGSASDTINNSIEVGTNASFKVVELATNLISVDGIGDEIKINHSSEDISKYVVSIMTWTNEATCSTVFNKDIQATNIGTINSGLYKNYFENSLTDGSTDQTRQQSGWYSGCIWRDGDTYKVYCTSTTQIDASRNATIYVYGYDSAGELKTYQTMSYSPQKTN